MKNAEIDEMVADLRSFAAGELDAREFRAKYMHARAPAIFGRIWDGLEHFLADADIRAKDAGYREMQLRELDRLIKLLQEGASNEELGQISCFGRSKL